MANPAFFSSTIKAGLHTSIAVLRGPSKTVEEMYEAQKSRYHTFADLLSSLSYTAAQQQSRKQYWCSQIFFLVQLIKRNPEAIQRLIGSQPLIESAEGLIETVKQLLHSLDNSAHVSRFIELLSDDEKAIQAASNTPHSTPVATETACSTDIQLVNGDVIQLINDLDARGFMVVTDDAPNSHRDGAAKYSNGSVEELFSRYCDSALKMATHFCDVHKRNKEVGHYAFTGKTKDLNVVEYQKRYLKMVLGICLKLLEKKEAYLNSREFLRDLLRSQPNPESGLPIYFDLQNNAYEVPVQGGYSSWHWFSDTKELTSIDKLWSHSNPIRPIVISSYAAPDLRTIETSPIDARATSNIHLQYPQKEGTMGSILTYGVKMQCDAAIALAKHYKEQGIDKPVAVVFVMPGCGAFKNPEKPTAAQFISTIKYYSQHFAALNIHCYLAEYNKSLYQLLQQANNTFGSELAEFNEAINNMVNSELRAQAIAVKEKILALYEQGAKPELLRKHLQLSKQLLTTPDGAVRDTLILEYHQNGQALSQKSAPLLRALGIAMMVLSAAIMAVGIALSFTGVGLIASAAVVGGSIGVLSAGIGLFASAEKKGLHTLSNDFEYRSQSPSCT